MGDPAMSGVELGVITVRASGGGGTGIGETFLRRSDKVGGGGAVGAAFCGRTSNAIGVAVGMT